MSTEHNNLDFVTLLEHETGKIPFHTQNRIARVSVLLGPDEGKTYKLTDDCVVGRASDATVRLPDRGISRHHVRFRSTADNRWVVEDQGSRNGTLVNGRHIARQALESGDRIQLGPRCLLQFSMHDDLEESLIQAKQVEIIGRLSAGINHDFNNLLCVILANAAYMLELPQDSTLANDEVRECLEDMRSAAQSGAELTNRLATLVQSGNLAQESVDLSQLCEETLAVLRDTFPKSISVRGHVQPGIWVRGVRAHLRQLLLNPCLNARDAMPNGGTLSFEAVLKGREELDGEPPIKADCYAVVSFADTGCGMTPEVLKAAFEPFFTTKEIQLGKGLGLPTVRKVASDHGGTAQLSCQVDKGTLLRIILPVVDLEDHAPENASPQAISVRATQERSVPKAGKLVADAKPSRSSTKGARRILVSQDDEALGRAFARSLRRAGYEVVWVPDGTQALTELREQAFDIVILDLDLPGAGGQRAHRAIRKRDEEVPIVLLSGAPDVQEADATGKGGRDTVVRKPIEPAVLARVVQLALRRAGRGSQP